MVALKRREEITQENTFEQKKKKPGLKFNPGLALIGLRTSGPRSKFSPMSQRREFKGKLTKELLRTVHYNLQTTIRLSFLFERRQGRPVFELLWKSVQQARSTEHK